ncbi:hypothetical protein K4L44_17200 [Halosquirtibacter laminarini]|uniref:Uncharacterized protein n=1 Tax=Halosquirtibacter laminarini TaxID=3374600 RepID=A0AC61NNE3_9BACT|nr:hypothetical protein K4L44_17200 [Prolixibacteraceae bacterium]
MADQYFYKKYNYNPNRRIEPAFKHGSIKEYMPFLISASIREAMLEKEKLESGKEGEKFLYADDEFLVYDSQSTEFETGMYYFWLFAIFPIFISFVYKIISGTISFADFISNDISILIGLLIPAVYFRIKKKMNSKPQIVIFDRLNGLVQVPTKGSLPPQLFRFEDLHIVAYLGSKSAAARIVKIETSRTIVQLFKRSINIPFYDVIASQSWSFCVWYMDKNRPLPLGTALDPYREKDYQRRLSEGMPEPLYPSFISTPEHFDKNFHRMYELNKDVTAEDRVSLNDRNRKKDNPYRHKRNDGPPASHPSSHSYY